MANDVLVTFASAGDADRRVAGVATAARIARMLADAGHDRIWLAVAGGEPLREGAINDLRRLVEGTTIRVVDGDALERAGIGRTDVETLEVVTAPRLSAAEILEASGKSGDGPVSRWLNRPVSRRISALLLHLFPGIRPAHATFGTALLAAAMFIALAIGGAPGLIAGGLLFHAASVFDGVDGEIARATFRTSPAGATLDTAIDMATNLLFILGVTINLAAREFPEALVAGGWGLFLFAIGLLVMAHRAARAEGEFNLDLLKNRYRQRFPGRLASSLTGFVTIVTSRDFFALLFALLIVAGTPMGVLYIFATAATVWILFVAAAAVPGRRPGPSRERSA